VLKVLKVLRVLSVPVLPVFTSSIVSVFAVVLEHGDRHCLHMRTPSTGSGSTCRRFVARTTAQFPLNFSSGTSLGQKGNRLPTIGVHLPLLLEPVHANCECHLE
jgi:hypothetical protein